MADQLAPGIEKENALRAAGFEQADIDQWRAETAQTLSQSGFASNEIDDYFGYKNPDMTPMKKVFEENAAAAENQTTADGKPKPRQAQTFAEAVEAGYQISVTGLIKRQKAPEIVANENASMFYRIAGNVSTLAGDLPAMWAGGLAGGAAAAPAAAAVAVTPAAPAAPLIEAAGAGYGSFALPAAIRKAMMDHYEKGDVQNFEDFWGRAAATFIEANKQGIVGAATLGVGKGVGGALAKTGAKAVTKTTAQLTAEVATMTTVGAAMEGHVPEPEHFLEAAITVGALKGVGVGATKLRRTYGATGVKPADVALRAQNDPLIKQDLLTEDVQIPDVIAKENGLPTDPMTALKQFAGERVPSLKEGIEASSRPEAVQKVLSQIGEPTKPEGKSYSLSQGYTDFVDKFYPIHRAVKALSAEKPIGVADDPYVFTRSSNDYKSKALHFFKFGTIDYETGRTTGKSLTDIIDAVKDPQGFDAYLAAKRAITDIETRGLKSGIDPDAAKETVKLGKDKFEAASKDLLEYQNRVLEYGRDSGMLSKESFDTLVEANKAYVPFKRILESGEAGGKGGKGKLSQLKEFKGSELKIQSPLLSILENTQSMLRVAEKNRAARSLVELAEKNPDQQLLTKVKSKTQAIEIKPEDIVKILEAHGVEAENAEAFTLFTKKSKANLNENEFEIFRNGKREVWETADPELAKAVKRMDGDPAAVNVLFKLAKNVSGVVRVGTSIMPDFQAKNLIRDTLTKTAFSKNTGIPIVDTLVAMKDVISQNEHYANWLKSGGAGGSFLELDNAYLKKEIFKLNDQTGFIDKTWNVIKTPYEFMKLAGSIAEQSTRLAEFKRASGGASEGPKLREGGYAAREITVDFTRIGAKMSALNAIIAFQNVSIQGLDRTVRAVKEKPIRVTTTAVATITVPSILLWWANKDDPRYKEIPRWQKDVFWIIPTDNWQKAEEGEAESGVPPHLLRLNAKGDLEINRGVIYRIPKPQELGILFGSLPERTMEKYFTENPNAMKDFNKTMWNLITPAIAPNIVAPIIEQNFDKGLFTGTKIIPGYLEKIAPEYQYTEYTTESAKQLAKMVSYVPGVGSEGAGDLSVSSPMVLENYVRAWSGNLGMYTLRIADQALIKSGAVPDPVKAADTLADIPFVKAFVVRHPSAGANSLQDFYDQYSKNAQTYDTINYLAKTGDVENLSKVLDDPRIAEKITNLSGVKEALTTQSQVIRLINKNKDYTPDEKRQLIDGIYYGMIEIAATANESMRELDKELKKEK